MISSSSISWKCSCRVCIRMIPTPTGSRNLTRLYCSWIKSNCSLPKTNCGFLCKHAQSDWHLPRHLSNELISKAGLLPSLLIGWQDLENLKPRKSQMSKTQVGDATSSFRRMCHEGSSKRVQALQRAFGPSCCLHTDVSRLAQTVKEPRCQSIATRTWCVWNLEQPSIQHERYADNDTFSKLPYSSFLFDSCESVFDVDMKHGKILQKHMATVSESNVKKLFLPGQDWFACDLSAYLSRVPQHCATASALKPWRRIK